jgi:DNA polymerase
VRVPGSGRCPCSRALVGEGPGWQEDRAGEPFVGKTGDELDCHLELNDLPERSDWWLTNIFRFYQGKDYVWTQEDLDRDIPDLTRELNRVRPKLIVTLGRYATRHFLGNVDMDATEMLPWFLPETFDRSNASWANESTVVFPITHPAAGFHNPDQSARTTVGFQELKRYLDGDITPRKLFDDPIPNPVYEEITSVFRLQQVLRRLAPGGFVSVDTEGWPWNPWSLQFSLEPGCGYVVRKGADRILAAFERCIRERGARLVFHSALHDLGMGRPLAISFDDIPFDDTMVMAYLLQIVPKGLKQSCLRECGMRMDDFTDLVAAPDRQLALTYLTNLWDLEETDYEQRQLEEQQRINATPLLRKEDGQPKRDKQGNIRYRHTTKLPSVPKTPLHKAVARCLQSKRPRQLWSDQVDDVLVAGYRFLVPIP